MVQLTSFTTTILAVAKTIFLIHRGVTAFQVIGNLKSSSHSHRYNTLKTDSNNHSPFINANDSHRTTFLLEMTASSSSSTTNTSTDHLEFLSKQLNDAIQQCSSEVIKTCKVKVKPSKNTHRLGLYTTEKLNKNDVALSIPYSNTNFENSIIFSPTLCTQHVYKNILPEDYDGWTGDIGLLALLVLNELARVSTNDQAGIPLPQRKSPGTSQLIQAWVQSLPPPNDPTHNHPILWNEDDQELLQSSSTKKIYKLLDDIDDDATWLQERIWSKDRMKFPEKVTISWNDGKMVQKYPCFTPQGFAWAVSIVSSRSFFVDGMLRLIPIVDMANHDDIGTEEVTTGTTRSILGSSSNIELRTSSSSNTQRLYNKEIDQEFFVNYGPKSSAEYLLEYGFIPPSTQSKRTSVAELTFEVDPDDRFYDDKMDILEFETYQSAPMDPSQTFDVVVSSVTSSDGQPDAAMMQFLRLVKLGGQDAFLLESIFRKEVWGFMSMPVSEKNEREVLDAIANSCSKALEEMCSDDASSSKGETTKDDTDTTASPEASCRIVREAEKKALSRTLEYVNREKEALDLKEYYQERRLKDLGLDSEWNPEESASGSEYDDDELSFGQSRSPGRLDW